MQPKRVLTVAIVGAALAGVAAASWFLWQRSGPSFSQASLLSRLPAADAAVLSLDFATLRRGNILEMLGGSKAVQEPEYQNFIKSSGFDYQRDLDSALVSFSPGGTYLLVKGRFDWSKLQKYAQTNGGSCYDQLCRMTGSAPDRRISFLPLAKDLMAMAVSTDDLAASRLQKEGPPASFDIPAQPVWFSIPSSRLQQTASLPSGTRVFASTMSKAERVTVTLGANGQEFEAHLEALCRSSADAQALSSQLEKLTATLRDLLPRGKSKPDELSALLTAGVFKQSDRKVFGYWPVRKGLIENLAGGM